MCVSTLLRLVDRFGIKPLFYTVHQGAVLLASANVDFLINGGKKVPCCLTDPDQVLLLASVDGQQPVVLELI